MFRRSRSSLVTVVGVLWVFACAVLDPRPAAAQDPDPDREVSLAEPDFTLGALPTTLRLPARGFNFRLTHRFSRPIAIGTVGDFFADFFGMDGAARIGLELRYGVRPGTQVVVHRTNDRAIQLLGQQQLTRQGTAPVSVHAMLAIEGGNNFSEDFGGAIGAVVSRTFTDRGAIYLQPVVVVNTNAAEPVPAREDRTAVLGVGARLRLGGSRVYLVAEAAPHIAGFDAGVDHVSVGIERRAGGHVFQLMISNALGTTLRQIARGGANRGDWHIGFNVSRKFF
jgi:hypothetical protein